MKTGCNRPMKQLYKESPINSKEEGGKKKKDPEYILEVHLFFVAVLGLEVDVVEVSKSNL